MEGKDNITDDLLLDYIDGLLDEAQNLRIKHEIGRNDELRERYEYLSKMDDHLQQLTISTPPDTFTSNVMEGLSHSIYQINRKSRFNGLLVLMLGVLTVVIGAVFISQGWSDMRFNQYLDISTISEAVKLPSNEVSLVFDLSIVTQGLLFLIGVLSLLIFDKVVLKPYFRQRRAQLNY